MLSKQVKRHRERARGLPGHLHASTWSFPPSTLASHARARSAARHLRGGLRIRPRKEEDQKSVPRVRNVRQTYIHACAFAGGGQRSQCVDLIVLARHVSRTCGSALDPISLHHYLEWRPHLSCASGRTQETKAAPGASVITEPLVAFAGRGLAT